MKKILTILVFLPCTTFAYFPVAKYINCYDGDTCRFNIPDIHPLLGENIAIRLLGIDTPEIKGKCQREKVLAKKAKVYLNNRLKKADRIELRNTSRGKYFRVVAEIWADGKMVNQELIDRGLAYSYDGGTKKGWCN